MTVHKYKKIYSAFVCSYGLVLMAFVVACASAKNTIDTKQNIDSATVTVIRFIELLNTSNYDQALALFATDTLEQNKISKEFFIEYVDENITRKHTISHIEGMGEEPGFQENTTRVNIKIHYKCDDYILRWLETVKVEGVCKLTSRGNLL